MGLKERLFQKEDLSRYLASDKGFTKTLNARDLISLGIGVVIGTGIFILPGTVAALHSGPAISLSFVIAALVCSLSAMCYAELSSALPVAGSAYSFGNVLYGESIGWFLGWALILEYMLAVAAVSTGWASYFNSFISALGLHMPQALSGPFDPAHGTYINITAVASVLIVALLLAHGSRTSVRVNDIMVIVKVIIILIFVVVGAFFIKGKNLHPFMPYGFSGVIKGSSLVFFAYLGFDVVAASAADVKDPQKNMPRGIIGTLVITTILYIAVSVVLTGMVYYKQLDVSNPVAYALQLVNQDWVAAILSVGALAGMATSMISTMFSSTRLIYSIGRDGLFPEALGKINPKTKVPTNSLIIVTIIIAFFGGIVSLDQITSLVNIGTLLAFTFVSYGVIRLRKRPDIKNTGFKVPFYPVLPLISVIMCLALMTQLPAETWLASLVWFVIGAVIYLSYGIRHSKLNKVD